MRCPNMEACALFPVFSNAPFLKVWQITYCESSEHKRCARFAGMCKGEPVPATLLPNGKHLPVLNSNRTTPDPTPSEPSR